MSQTEFRRRGERHFSLDTAEQEMRQYVGKHGVKAAIFYALGIATALNIDVSELWVPFANGRETESAENGKPAKRQTVPPSRPAPIYFNHGLDASREASRNPRTVAWETRRAVDVMLAANPLLSRAAALELYRSDQRANPTGPRNHARASTGEISWDSRVKNIIKKAAAKGETLSWQEAHQRALASLQGSRQAA